MSCACHPGHTACSEAGGVIHVTQKTDLARCFEIRRAVFIEEQGIPEAEEWDDKDLLADHFLIFGTEGPAGTARCYADGPALRIGRIAVLKPARGAGLAGKLMQTCLEHTRQSGAQTAVLDAQLQAMGLYERFGFTAEGDAFDDGSGILHRRMSCVLS